MFDFRTNITKSVLFLYLKSLIPSVFKLGHWHLSYHGFNLLVLEQCMCHDYLRGLGEVPRDMYTYLFIYLKVFIYFIIYSFIYILVTTRYRVCLLLDGLHRRFLLQHGHRLGVLLPLLFLYMDGPVVKMRS